jgi:hypothetical protein
VTYGSQMSLLFLGFRPRNCRARGKHHWGLASSIWSLCGLKWDGDVQVTHRDWETRMKPVLMQLESQVPGALKI